MNNQRILIGILIASWTLNVALGVALYLNTHFPQGGFWHNAPPPGMTRPFGMNPDFPRHPEFAREMEPLHEERIRIMVGLAEALTSEILDSARISELSDSLEKLNCRFQQCRIKHMMQMHDNIPPEARQELVPRMMKRLGMPEKPGRHHGGFHEKMKNK